VAEYLFDQALTLTNNMPRVRFDGPSGAIFALAATTGTASGTQSDR
jgi:hypothetical protein